MNTTNSDWTTGKAISAFYDMHDFGQDGGINEKFAWIKFGIFSIPIPNAKSRRQNIYLHDVSHLVTGYDTSWKGESAVSAWEIATGGWNRLFIPWLLTLWAMGLGTLFYPSSVYQAFQKGLTMRNALTCGLTKVQIFELPLEELKTRLNGYPRRDKNPFLWMMISLVVFLTPFLFLAILGLLGYRFLVPI